MISNKQKIGGIASAMLLALSAALPARADYQSTVISQGPVGYWRLNETLSPANTFATNSGSLGSAANGSFVNLPTLGAAGPFAGSTSVGLDGVTEYVTTPYTAGLNTSTFSYEMWLNPATTSLSTVEYVASSVYTTSPRTGWYFAQDTSSGGTFGNGNSYNVRFFYTNSTTPSVTLHSFVTPGWTHMVITFDGTTASLYTNGVLAFSAVPATNAAGVRYVPNSNSPFTVGSRSDGTPNFPWGGNVAEVALYPGALSATRVAAHYTAATTAPSSYASTVLADAPLLYDRYQSQPYTISPNLGTLGTSGNALYVAPVSAGGAGPAPTAEPGFSSTNVAPYFTGGGGAVKLPAFNFNTNTVTISGWVNATVASESKSAGIVVCDSGSTVAGLNIDNVNGGLGLGYIWNNDPNTYNTSLNGDLGLPLLNQSEWAYVALVIQSNEADIYVASPTIPFTGVTNPYAHVNQSFSGNTLIGYDSAATNFVGGIDEVAIWNRSLSSGELYSQYASAIGGLPPIVFGSPQSPASPVYGGDTLTLTVNAGGTPNLSYQWRLNSTPIAGATNATYVKGNFSTTADVGTYDVVVTNLYGSVTSGTATVTGISPTAPVIVSSPAGANIYPGGTLNLSVVASGGGMKYQWSKGGTPISGATNSFYLVSSVTTNNAGSYTVSATNLLGTASAGPAVITVPTLVSNSYAQVVDADGPEGWWRLDETSAVTGATLYDAMNRHNGVYTNLGGLTVGQSGALTAFGGLGGTAASFTGDGSYGYVPASSVFNGGNFTLECWALLPAASIGNINCPVSVWNNGYGYAIGSQGGTWYGNVGVGGTGYIFGQGAGVTAGYNPTTTANQWVHLVIVYNTATVSSGTHYPYTVYVNGATDGYIWGDGSFAANTPLFIGGRGTGTTPTIINNLLNGKVDEVAFYSKVLTAAQILAHYNAAFYGVPPTFTVQPQSQTVFVSNNVTFTASAVGSPTITYQWKKNGTSLTGQTNTSYTLTNVFYTSASDIYTVVATNPNGSVVSSNAVVTVYYPPTFAYLTNGLVLHLPFDNNYNDTSGHGNYGTPSGTTFTAGKIGSNSVVYQTLTTTNISSSSSNVVFNSASYVDLGTGHGISTDLRFGAADSFTVALWVKEPAGYTGGDLPFIGTSVGSFNNFGWALGPTYATGGWQWGLNDGTNNFDVTGSANSINDGNWHNFVLSVNRSNNTANAYLDGVNVSSQTISGLGSLDSTNLVTIGQDPTHAYPGSFSNASATDLTAWSGTETATLDDLGIWRRALTDYEAKSIYFVGQNYGKSFDVQGHSILTLSPLSGGAYGVTWQTGTLQSATNLLGPWTTVAGATAPFYQFTPVATGNKFYRVSQ